MATATSIHVHPPAISIAVRLRVLAVFAALGIAVVLVRMGTVGAVRASYDESLVAALASEGLVVERASVQWLDVPGRLGARPVLFLAERRGELPDLYYAEARLAGPSAVLDVLWLRNVSRTSSAAERDLVRVGDHVAFSTQVGDTFSAIELLDTRGEPASMTADWPARAKVQHWIRKLQQTGRGAGLGRRRYQLVPTATMVRLQVEGEHVVADIDGTRVEFQPNQPVPLQGADRVELRPTEQGMPGTITWVVDTVRNISFIGPTPIEWLEHTVFGITDRFSRTYHRWVDTDTEAEVKQAFALPELPPEEIALLRATDPELGWPPESLTPVLDRKVRGEGEWMPVADPEFVNSYPNAPTAFFQTFLRVDPERDFTRVYITLWDPRQVQLGIVMGTQEPESATGETGSGMIPRDARTLRNVVAAFNGGFQAVHGEFGMMADGQVYLPPKPFAATVAVFDDGRVGFGSWPGPSRGVEWNEEVANSQIPTNMVSMRQNLTSVVEDDKLNPWERWWWGAAPPWAAEQTYIHRTGLCLTKAGFVAYFWGDSLGPDELGKAMLATGCVRGMHLDMNSKHTGFEFYRPLVVGASVAPLDRALASTEFEGSIPQAPGMNFRARLGVTTMSPMTFPRYLLRDRRDYFYLTLKPVLPGPGITVGARELQFSAKGLPHAGWPHAFARLDASARDAGAGHQWLVRVDPARAIPESLADASHVHALAYLTGGKHDTGAVALVSRRVRSGVQELLVTDQPRRTDTVVLRGPPLEAEPAAGRAIGVDAEGFLLYGEFQQAEPGALAALLRAAGVEHAIALETGSQLAFVVDGQPVAVDGTPAASVDPASSLALLAEERPAAEVLFPETTPRPYRRWAALQDKRVRYFPRTESPRFRAPGDAL